MRKVVWTALFAVVMAVAQESAHPADSGSAHAEAAVKQGEGHAQAPMPNEIWWKWANFALLAGLLGWLISKNAGPFFQSRSEAIEKGIAESTLVLKQAEARAAEIEARVANLAAEVEELKQRSHEEIGREGERMRAESEAQIRKVQAHAESEIAAAGKNASHELKDYAAQLALNLAAQQIRDRMTPETQSELTSAFVDGLRRNAEMN